MKNPVMRAKFRWIHRHSFHFFALVVVDVHHRKWKNIPPYNSNNNIYTYSTCVSCTNIILCGHIWNICHCDWTWQLLLFFHFHFIIFVFCVLFPSLFFSRKKEEKRAFIAEAHSKITAQWTMSLRMIQSEQQRQHRTQTIYSSLEFWGHMNKNGK